METKELTTRQHGITLRGICGGAALKDKSLQISEDSTVITCAGGLEIWDIYCISSDTEASGLKPLFGYDGHMRITFTPRE